MFWWSRRLQAQGGIYSVSLLWMKKCDLYFLEITILVCLCKCPKTGGNKSWGYSGLSYIIWLCGLQTVINIRKIATTDCCWSTLHVSLHVSSGRCCVIWKPRHPNKLKTASDWFQLYLHVLSCAWRRLEVTELARFLTQFFRASYNTRQAQRCWRSSQAQLHFTQQQGRGREKCFYSETEISLWRVYKSPRLAVLASWTSSKLRQNKRPHV